MKQIVRSILLFSATTAFMVWAWPTKGSYFYAAAAAGGGGCTTPRDAEATAIEDHVYINGGILAFASPFVAGGTYTICSATVYLKKGAAPTGNLTVGIFTNNAGNPGTLVGTASGNLDVTTLTTTSTPYTLTGMSASLTSGVTYHVLVQNSVSPAGANEIGVEYADEATVAIAFNDTTTGGIAAGTGWTNPYIATSRIRFALFSN